MDQSPKPGPQDEAVRKSLDEASKTCEALTAGLASMNITETVASAKSMADYMLILDMSEMITGMCERATSARDAFQDLRKSASDQTAIKAFEEVDQGFDTLLTRIEGLRKCVDEWMESMMRKPSTSVKNNTSGPAA